MPSHLTSSVEQVVAAGLEDLSVGQLQAHARELRSVAGRLLGRADQALAVLHERSGGQVLDHPGHAPAVGELSADESTGLDTEPVVTPAMPLLMSVQTWWREATCVSGSQAGRDLRRAGVLARFPVWGQAVTDGVLTPEQAQVLCRLAGKLPDAELEVSQAELVLVASRLNPVELGQYVRHLIATWCEPELEAEQDKAESNAWLQLDKRPDGRLAGRFVISSEDSEALLTVLEPLARRDGLGDARSAGRRRADALVEVFTAAARWMDLPSSGGRPTHVSYVVPSGWAGRDVPPALSELLQSGALTLLGQARTARPPGCTVDLRPSSSPRGKHPKLLPDPVTGEGVHPIVVEEHVATASWSGPQTRARIEATLCDARISRVLRDGLGQVVSLQTLTDDITTAQRKAVSARDRHCVARGCTRPPGFSDLHHLLHHEDGGTTDLDNLVLLCRRHHVLWHRGRLALTDLHVPWLRDTRAA